MWELWCIVSYESDCQTSLSDKTENMNREFIYCMFFLVDTLLKTAIKSQTSFGTKCLWIWRKLLDMCIFFFFRLEVHNDFASLTNSFLILVYFLGADQLFQICFYLVNSNLSRQVNSFLFLSGMLSRSIFVCSILDLILYSLEMMNF